MERSHNSTAPEDLHPRAENVVSRTDNGDGNAYLYILIVMSFYGVFLFGIMLGYFRSKRREKRRSNVFTRLVHEGEQRRWGAFPKKHSITFPAIPGLHAAVQVSLPSFSSAGGSRGPYEGGRVIMSPLACALCAEQTSVSSLCSSADVRFAIEEESDSGTAEGPEEAAKLSSENSDDSADLRREES